MAVIGGVEVQMTEQMEADRTAAIEASMLHRQYVDMLHNEIARTNAFFSVRLEEHAAQLLELKTQCTWMGRDQLAKLTLTTLGLVNSLVNGMNNKCTTQQEATDGQITSALQLPPEQAVRVLQKNPSRCR